MILQALFLAAIVLAPVESERWRPPELRVRKPPKKQTFEEVRDIAFQYLGRPYSTGGVGSPAFDCSGFVCRVFAEAGWALPRVSRDQARAGKRVPIDRLLPGDLLFFSSTPGGGRITHVAIYLGNSEVVHATSSGGKVEVASLKSAWYRGRLVEARRVLPDPDSPLEMRAATSSASFDHAPTLELVEHTGDSSLSPMVRLPPEHPVPSYGPELESAEETSIGVRSALVTDQGTLGITVAPEGQLKLDDIALVLALSVPIRFNFGAHATIGSLSSAADYTRFVREASLGLRGADLELRLSRLGDMTLLDGLVVDRLAPGSLAGGVPGLSIGRSPLSFFGAVRSEIVDAELLADDVVDPALFGAALRIPLLTARLHAGVAAASDQSALYGQNLDKRAIGAAEARLDADLIQSQRWSLLLGASAAELRALGLEGRGVLGESRIEHRFGSYGAASLRLGVRGGWLGARFLDRLFGPTYLVARAQHLGALESVAGRATLGGDIGVASGHLTIGASFADALGESRHPYDRQVSALFAVEEIPLGGTRLIDIRLAVSTRGLFTPGGALTVVHGGVRVRFTSWFFGELYLEEGKSLQGGGGFTLTLTP